jgi:hypothetical protein
MKKILKGMRLSSVVAVVPFGAEAPDSVRRLEGGCIVHRAYTGNAERQGPWSVPLVTSGNAKAKYNR